MEQSLSSLKFEGAHVDSRPVYKCSGCSETFQSPILATIFSHGYAHSYQACPRCLSRITVVKQPKESERSERKEFSAQSKPDKPKSVGKVGENVDCKHSFGYLKNYPKNKPFPDECLTCSKMVECMLR